MKSKTSQDSSTESGNGKNKAPRSKTKKELQSEEDRRILTNAAILRAMPDDIAGALAKARTKPIWCSDVRWRMELARRKNRYSTYNW